MPYVDIYITELNKWDISIIAEFDFLIDKKRLEYCESFKDKKQKLQRKVSSLLLYYAISNETNLSKMPEICKQDSGEIMLKHCDKYISTSYSDTFIVVAISNCKIGIDVEKITCIDDSVTKRYLNNIEYSIYSLVDNKKEEAAIRFWCCKEAYLKFLGVGLLRSPKTVNTVRLKQFHTQKIGDSIYALYSSEYVEVNEYIIS